MLKKSLALISLLLAFSLCSCGIITINKGNGSSGTEDTDDGLTHPSFESKDYPLVPENDGRDLSSELLSKLPTVDLEGRTVFIAAEKTAGDIFSEESEIFSSAVIYRNELVAKKYNVKLVTDLNSKSELLDEVKKADKAGEYYADFAVIRCGDVGAYLAGGYLRNLRSLQNAELDDDCYNKQAMSQLSVGGFDFGAVGYATEDIGKYSCLFFNKTLAEEKGITLDYSEIYGGEFTYETLLDLIKLMPEDDTSFAVSSTEDAVYSLFFSAGQTYLSPNGGEMSLSCSNERSEKLIEALKSLSDSMTEKVKATDSGESVTLKGFDVFENGKSLIYQGSIDDMKTLKNCGFSWEVLPLPKVYETDDSYYTAVTDGAPIMTALATGENIDTVGYILRALNTASYSHLKHEMYKYAEKELITGTRTLDMLDLATEAPIYDMASMFSSAKAVSEGTREAFYSAVDGKKSFETCLSAKESVLNKYLNRLP